MAPEAALVTDRPLNDLMANMPTTIFEVMSRLAVEHKSVNLGQGFPDDEGPESMKELAGTALIEHHNQYPSLLGMPELRQAVAAHSEREQGIPCNWQTETLVTVGATEGIAACFLGLLNQGDEVIMFDPMYDSYAPMAKRSGGVVRAVKLALPDFHLPKEELAALFNEKTKLILVNSPHNPSGKVFDDDELAFIAELCVKHNVIAMCDEVYEHLVFGGKKHKSLRAFPGMGDRSIRLGSAGKTFSFTAWKVGWITAPAHLLAPVVKAHQFLVFTVPSNLQRAVAHGLDKEMDFYQSLGPALERKRGILETRLAALGFGIVPTHGAYFMTCDASKFMRPGEKDSEFAIRLTKEAGVTTIPISGFYVTENPPTNYVRFCFCKHDEKLTSACDKLETYFGPGGQGRV